MILTSNIFILNTVLCIAWYYSFTYFCAVQGTVFFLQLTH